jgi:hypothetical protein
MPFLMNKIGVIVMELENPEQGMSGPILDQQVEDRQVGLGIRSACYLIKKNWLRS